MAGKGPGCSGDIVARISDMTFFSTYGHFIVPLWSSFQHTQVSMLRVRRTNGKEKGSCQENCCNKKIMAYSKATLKDKLRHRKVFRVTFEHSFLFTLLNAGGRERQQLNNKEDTRTELKRVGRKETVLTFNLCLYRKY